jgi:hypothetical protein
LSPVVIVEQPLKLALGRLEERVRLGEQRIGARR